MAKTVPRAKRVPIRKLRLPAWYCLRRNSNLYDIFLFRKANCSRVGVEHFLPQRIVGKFPVCSRVNDIIVPTQLIPIAGFLHN